MNPVFFLLALLAGFACAWFFAVVKTVKREVGTSRVSSLASGPALREHETFDGGAAYAAPTQTATGPIAGTSTRSGSSSVADDAYGIEDTSTFATGSAVHDQRTPSGSSVATGAVAGAAAGAGLAPFTGSPFSSTTSTTGPGLCFGWCPTERVLRSCRDEHI